MPEVTDGSKAWVAFSFLPPAWILSSMMSVGVQLLVIVAEHIHVERRRRAREEMPEDSMDVVQADVE
jgi:hypothetical protein